MGHASRGALACMLLALLPAGAVAADCPSTASTAALFASNWGVDERNTRYQPRSLLSADNLVRVERSLAAAEATMVALPEVVEELRGETRETLASGRALMQRAGAALARLEPSMARTAEGVDRGVDELARTLGAARDSLAAVERLSNRFEALAGAGERLLGQNQQTVRAFLVEARDAMRELRGLARQLQVAPSSLLFGVDSEEIQVPAAPLRGRR